MNVSELAVGIFVVALGASIPELTVAVMSSARHQPAVGIGNIIGSKRDGYFFSGRRRCPDQAPQHTSGYADFRFPMVIFFTILVSILLNPAIN